MLVETVGQPVVVDVGGALIVISLLIAGYVVTCISIYKIAKETRQSYPVLAWFPLIQFIPLIKSAQKPVWFFLLLLIPYVNVLAITWLFISLAHRVGKPPWIGLFVLVPAVNLLVLPYLAYGFQIRRGARYNNYR